MKRAPMQAKITILWGSKVAYAKETLTPSGFLSKKEWPEKSLGAPGAPWVQGPS